MKAAILITWLCALVMSARAAPVLNGTATPEGAGWRYEWTLTSDRAGQTIVQVAVPSAGAIADSISSPMGWSHSILTNGPYVFWAASDLALAATIDMPVSGFGFVSTEPPTENAFLAIFGEPDESGMLLGRGFALSPAPTGAVVPEPATFLPIAIFLSVLVAARSAGIL